MKGRDSLNINRPKSPGTLILEGPGSRYWTTRKISNVVVTTTGATTQTISGDITGTGQDGVSWEYSLDGLTNWTVKGTSASGSYSAAGLTSGTLYYWRARLYKGTSYSDYSNIYCEQTQSVASLVADYKMALPDEFASHGSAIPFTMCNLPSAIQLNGVTYIAWAGASFDPYIITYTHATCVWSTEVQIGTGLDDHGSPSLLIDDQGYIHAFYGGHSTAIKYSKSNNPLDISAWTLQTSPATGTYPCVLQSQSGNLFMFYRTYLFAFVYRSSSDRGATWSAETTIYSNADPGHYGGYFGYRKGQGNKIHCFGHDIINQSDPSGIQRTNQHYFYFDGTNFKNSADEVLTFPLSLNTPADMAKTRIYNSGGKLTGYPALSFDSNDNPSMLFVESDSSANSTNCVYKHGVKTGATWTFTNIASCNDILQRSILITNSPLLKDAYLTRGGAGSGSPYNYGGYIEKWTTTDGGVTWSKIANVSQITLFGFLQYVENPHANLRFVAGEIYGTLLNVNPYQTGTSGGTYAYGDTGFLGRLYDGVKLYDSSSNKLHGTILAAPTIAAGGGYLFPGGTSYKYAEIIENVKFSFGNAGTDVPFSVTFRHKAVGTTGTQFIFSKEKTSYEWRIDILNGVLRIILFMSNASHIIFASMPFTDTASEHFIAMTYSGSKAASGLKIYQDGGSESQTVQTNDAAYTGMSITSSRIYIGNNGGVAAELNGALKLLKLWNKALTPTEIVNVMNGVNL